MKLLFTIFSLCLATFTISAQATFNFHDYSAINLAGDTVHMSQYYGKKVMVINCASFCSYTPQYTPLQQIYDLYRVPYNFEIIGFPSDDFLNQGGSDSEIINTCNDYGVTFPIMEKVHVSAVLFGNNVDPVFQWLEKSSLNGVSNASVSWNFNKFLVDEAGHWVRSFNQDTEPKDTAITNWIMSPSVISSVSHLSAPETIELTSPNPTGSSLDFQVKNIETQHFQIEVYSSCGQLVETIYNGTLSANQRISFPVQSLSPGFYFVNVHSRDSEKTFRIVLTK